MDGKRLIAIALTAASAAGCATTDDSPHIRERLAGGGVGMLTGALAGVGGALALTGGEPDATLYVSFVTVPTGALIGLVAGINKPATFRNPAPAAVAHSSADMPPEVQYLVRTVAYEVKDRRSRTRKK